MGECMTESLPCVVIAYARFLEYQERRRRTITEGLESPRPDSAEVAVRAGLRGRASDAERQANVKRSDAGEPRAMAQFGAPTMAHGDEQ